jgi:hypothetical protein
VCGFVSSVLATQPTSIDGLQLVARRALLRPAAAAGCKHLKHLRMWTALHIRMGNCGDFSLVQSRYPIVFRDSMDFNSTNQAGAKGKLSKKADSEQCLGKKIICRCGKLSGCNCAPDWPIAPPKP